jgi:hypothetical protein
MDAKEGHTRSMARIIIGTALFHLLALKQILKTARRFLIYSCGA